MARVTAICYNWVEIIVKFSNDKVHRSTFSLIDLTFFTIGDSKTLARTGVNKGVFLYFKCIGLGKL